VSRVVAPAISGYTLVFLANLLENVPFVTNKIAADAGLHNFRKRNDLSDVVTTVPVPVQYNFFQQDIDHKVSRPLTNSGLNREMLVTYCNTGK
jgi:hypothetical protein